MFRVLSVFADLQDSNHIYNEGDVYPRVGYTPSDVRLEELSTNKNRLHKPLIEAVIVKDETKSEIEQPTEEVEAKPTTRGRKKTKDVGNAN